MSEGLSVRNVTVERDKVTVLRDISFAAEYGSIIAILGPNGAGKTTLLDTIAGFHAFSGELCLDGQPLAHLGRRERAQKLAYVPQASRLDTAMRVYDVVAQGRFAHRDSLLGLRPADRGAIDNALAETDTTQFAERAFTQLSIGERRRVLIARALATGARVLLLDEPSASLDIGQALSLFALLGRLADTGHCILAVLHDLAEANRCADRALLLEHGRMVAHGPISDVVAHEPVRRVYAVEIIPQGGLGYRRAAQR
jgi:iron complex transport system ATP-binding protein